MHQEELECRRDGINMGIGYVLALVPGSPIGQERRLPRDLRSTGAQTSARPLSSILTPILNLWTESKLLLSVQSDISYSPVLLSSQIQHCHSEHCLCIRRTSLSSRCVNTMPPKAAKRKAQGETLSQHLWPRG